MSLGSRLKELRKEKQLSIREVAKIFNIGKTTVSNYENDERKPDYEMIKKFAEFYGVTTDYLLGLTDERNIYKLKKDELPLEIRELGVEYITVTKELKEKGLSPEDIRKIVKFVEDIKKQDNKK
ncbi:helix-turn-helix domain-containing protein [Caloranaerobacter sp. DY30410]|uniref:helix-turn-helix domain-containing protein n=1 Tax=Caloranaerobacter sp. DY30410 TaxID=3238305 RepID=UPI003D01DECD